MFFGLPGMGGLLLGLAAHDGAQVRLFNPFAGARGSSVGRWMQMAGDFQRLNHRMHNKLFIADGAMAIVGGRNLADGYFQRDAGAAAPVADLAVRSRVAAVSQEGGAACDAIRRT